MIRRAMLICALMASAMGVTSPITFQKTGTKIEVSRKSPGDAETLTLGSGDVVVGWYSSADHQLQARIYKNSNPTVAGDVIVVHQSSAESTTVFASGRKQLAALSDGGFLITYQENTGLYRRQYTSTGRPVGGAVLIATVGATAGRHSAVGFRTGGGAVVLFTSTGGSFRMFSLAANSLTPVTVLGTSVTFYDMIEISAGLLVVFSEGTSELFYKVLSSVSFAELSSGTIAAYPTAWDRISLKMSHGRETPLITLAAHDSLVDLTSMRTWLFTDDIAVSNAALIEGQVLDHLTLGMGSSNKGQTILFSSTGFAYYNNDYSDISSSGFRSSLAVSETLTKVSVAQLGVNGWFAVFPSQTAEEVPVPIIAASYYHVPEVQFVTDIELDAMSSCRLDNGGYAVAYRTNAGAVMYALFDDDNNMKSKKTIGTGATTAPIIAGSLPHSNTFFVTYGDGGIRSVEVDATGDGTEQTALVHSDSSDHRSFLCGGSLVVIILSMIDELEEGVLYNLFILSAYVGGASVEIMYDDAPFIWDSACGAGGTYYVSYILDGTSDVNYVPITGTTIGDTFDFPFHGFSPPVSIKMFTPTQGSLIIFIVDLFFGLVHSRSITSSVTWSTSLTCFRNSLTFSQSLYDDSFSVSCASELSPVKDIQGGAIMFTRMEASGAEIEPSRAVNNFVIGTQANPSMIATDKGVVIVYATATTSITGDPIGVSLPIEVDAGYERQPETASNTLRGFQRSPASCGFSGGAVVVWESHVGAVSQIYAQIYDTTGRAIFDKEFMVSGGTSAPEDRPDVACSRNNFYVSWQSAVGSSTTINVLQFASNGDKIGSPVLIHTIASGGDARPVIATTTSGNKYVVSWQANLGTGNDVDVYMSVVEGSAISDPIIVHGTLQLTQRNPSVDITDDDSVIIAWQSFNEDGSGYGIFARVFDVSQANPVASAAAFQVNTETEGSQTSPRVAFFSDKKFIIIWGSGTVSTLFNVMGAVYSAGAVKQGSDFRVNAEEIGNDRPTSICILPDDSFIVAWNRFEIRLTQDAYFRRFDTSGRPLGGDQLINKFTRRRQFDATIALLHNDNFIISWTSKWQDRSSWSIYSSAYSRVPTVTTYGVPTDQSSIVEQVVKPLSDGRVLSLYIVKDLIVTRLIGEVENTDGTSFRRDILQLTNIGLGSTYDVTVVGTTAYVVVHDGGASFTYKIISFEISASTLSSPVVVASFVAINEAAVYPKISIDSGTTLIHVLHRDGNSIVGNNLYLESFDTNGGGVNKVSLFPRMNSFTHGSMSFLSSGYFVIANSMRRTTTTRLYLSVVKTDGNVAKTVALTTADEQLYSEVGILSDNRVVVCYARRNLDLIDCQIYKITLGTDVFIKKVGPTCKTFIYGSTRTIGMSVVGDDKFAVTGVSYFVDSVYVKVLNSKFEVLEAYRAFSQTFIMGSAIASIAKFQESGLIVPMQVNSGTGRKLMWKLTSPVVTKIDSDVPTDESIPVDPYGEEGF